MIEIRPCSTKEIGGVIINHREVRANKITFKPNANYIGAFHGQKCVGCVAYIEYANTVKLCSAFVLPEYRGRGIYKDLFDARLNQVSTLKKTIVSFLTKNSLPLHLKYGAKIVKVYKRNWKVIYEVKE